jgi:hypothetical protein
MLFNFQAWILSREKKLNQAIMERLENILRLKDVNLDNLITIDQVC